MSAAQGLWGEAAAAKMRASLHASPLSVLLGTCQLEGQAPRPCTFSSQG